MKLLVQLYQQVFGNTPDAVSPLAKAGSNRAYYRLTNAKGESVVGVVGNNIAENRAFLYLAEHFAQQQLPVPYIYGVSADESRYLQTDFGNRSLYDELSRGRHAEGDFDTHEREMLERTLRLLPHVQIKGGEGLDVARLLPPTTFNRKAAMFDLNYFKYCFLKPIDLPFDEMALEDDFEQLAVDLVDCAPQQTSFLYRDFQARNVMIVDNAPHLIDFQGGRCGPLPYDVASFLWQASAQYPNELRQHLIEVYLDELSTLVPTDKTLFRQQLQRFVLFRLLQVLGAYGLRGITERKPYFLNSIPPALSNLRQLLIGSAASPYPTLRALLVRLSQMDINSIFER